MDIETIKSAFQKTWVRIGAVILVVIFGAVMIKKKLTGAVETSVPSESIAPTIDEVGNVTPMGSSEVNSTASYIDEALTDYNKKVSSYIDETFLKTQDLVVQTTETSKNQNLSLVETAQSQNLALVESVKAENEKVKDYIDASITKSYKDLIDMQIDTHVETKEPTTAKALELTEKIIDAKADYASATNNYQKAIAYQQAESARTEAKASNIILSDSLAKSGGKTVQDYAKETEQAIILAKAEYNLASTKSQKDAAHLKAENARKSFVAQGFDVNLLSANLRASAG